MVWFVSINKDCCSTNKLIRETYEGCLEDKNDEQHDQSDT